MVRRFIQITAISFVHTNSLIIFLNKIAVHTHRTPKKMPRRASRDTSLGYFHMGAVSFFRWLMVV